MSDEPICPKCLAREVAANVLNQFSDECPDVSMPYNTWMMLGVIIEEEIKEALGVESEEGEGSSEAHEEHTVQ